MTEPSKAKKVLLIAYQYPPIGGIAVQRPLKFSRYLGEFGWHPCVLTVKNGYSPSQDESLLQEIPEDVAVLRASDLYAAFLRWYQRRGSARSAPAAAADGAAAPAASASAVPGSASRPSSFPRRLFRAAKGWKDRLLIPDEQIFWFPAAVRLGLQAIRQHQVQAIYSTSGPATAHLVAYWLKKRTGLPWIADFRDPWTQNLHVQQVCAAEEAMERAVMENADVVLTVTRSFADGFAAKYGGAIRRLEVIYNGFDPQDFAAIEPLRDDPRFTLLYGGILYGKRSPRVFLEGLRLALDRGYVPQEDITVHFAGIFDYPGKTENQDLVRRLGLESNVRLLGYLSHRETIARMKGADILLLIGDVDAKAGQYIPGKLFEYMAAGRPVLSLSVPGEAASLVQQYSLGVVSDPQDPTQVAKHLGLLYERWKKERVLPGTQQDGQLSPFDRREQSKRLAELLDELSHAK